MQPDAFSLTFNLCFSFFILVLSILRQISVDYLEQAMDQVDIDDEIKADVYKERAQYLEQMYYVKHLG